MISLALALAVMASTNSDSRPPQTVDATTLHKKVLCGYQGWFRAAGDGGRRWDHWNRDWNTAPRTNALDKITFEMWPDVSEYSNKYAVPGFTCPGGAQAYLYSAEDQQTVDKHFDWMQQYGIDGVVVQRFVTDTPPDNVQSWKTNVLRCVRVAAHRTGRVFCLEYDMSGANNRRLFSQLTNDWIYLFDNLKLTRDPRYLYHNGKPVLMIFGFYPERFPDPSLPKQIIAWFEKNTICPVTFIGSGWWNWRAGAIGEWTNIYRSFDGYCPWNTGNYTWMVSNGVAKKYASTSYWRGDITAAAKAGMFYLPQIYPGFGWDNLKRLPLGTSTVPRLGGDFFWKQFYDVGQAGLDMVFVGMFDEVDEGTAIYKVTNRPPTQAHFDTFDGLPSDWYLRLTGEGAKVIRGERPNRREMPISP
jgi:hypothetical protein